MKTIEQIIAIFSQAATQPLEYARQWKINQGKPVVGILPMNFPAELVHAAGALPMVLQADDEPVSIGLSRIDSFYCGYNRSLVNQTLSDEFNFLDAIMLGDHCVQILGTADTMRNHMPDVPVLYDQLVSTINAPWATSESLRCLNALKSQLEAVLDIPSISTDALQRSIAIANHNRQLLRQLYELRRLGKLTISSANMQHIIKSSMIMDREQHSELIEQLLTDLKPLNQDPGNRIPVYLSGHMCHAPKPELLDAIETCGGLVVADDLYTGFRYISTDVDEDSQPMDALVKWYLQRNEKVPCPTRSARVHDWDEYLLNAVKDSGAQGVIILLVKFCEPHMFYYPELKEKFDSHEIPHLLIETEHEEMPMEALYTRLETFMEIAKSPLSSK
jgi:benzoyl-CoA reductase subunit C